MPKSTSICMTTKFGHFFEQKWVKKDKKWLQFFPQQDLISLIFATLTDGV